MPRWLTYVILPIIGLIIGFGAGTEYERRQAISFIQPTEPVPSSMVPEEPPSKIADPPIAAAPAPPALVTSAAPTPKRATLPVAVPQQDLSGEFARLHDRLGRIETLLQQAAAPTVVQVPPKEPPAKEAPTPSVLPGAGVDRSRCQAVTRAGTRCKRKARADGKYCWQHERGVGNH